MSWGKHIVNTFESIPGATSVMSNLSPKGAIDESLNAVIKRVDNSISSIGRNASAGVDDDLTRQMKASMQSNGISAEAADNIASGSKSSAEAERVSKELKALRDQDGHYWEKAFAGGQGIEGANGGIINTLKTYYGAGDKGNDAGVMATRIGATVGASMLGGTMLRGGSLTRNEYGERDIAGIPFI